MPRPFVRKKFAGQPAYPATIDVSHPLGRKVTAGFSAHLGSATSPIEIISGLPAAKLSGALSSVMGNSVGRALRPSSTSSGVSWTPNSIRQFCDGSKPFSYEWLFTYYASDAQFSRYLDCGGAGAGGGITGGWDVEASASPNIINFVLWNGSSPSTTYAMTVVVGQTYHVVFTWDLSGNSPTIYINGQPNPGIAGQVITTANTAQFFYSTYHAAGDLSASGAATHLFRAYHGTVLTPAEVKRLYERPFEMFQAPRRILGNTVSGGGGVTLALTGVQATSAVGSVGTGQLLTVPLTGTASTSAVGSVGSAQLLTLGLTGVSAASSVGTVGVIAGGDKTFALTGVQVQTQTGNVGVQGADSTSQGGHFLPLTEKQLRNLRKEERKRRRQDEDREAARLADAQSIEAEIRELAFPAPVKPQEIRVETKTDDDDEDLELILLHS